MKILCLLSILLTFFIQGIAFSEIRDVFDERPDIEGHWKSVGAEDFHDGTFGTRIYKFENTSWSETIIIYSDRNLIHPLFKIKYEGVYDITTHNTSIYKTYNINFHFSKKSITLLVNDRELIKSMGFKSCNPKKDEEIDVSEKGCAFIASISDYPVQYDIVKKDLDLLFLGIHSYEEKMDEADKRATFFHYPLRKYNPRKESEWVKSIKSVYVLISFDIKNELEFEKFKHGHVESMHKYGGMEVAYSNDIRIFQGNSPAQNMIIQLWPDEEQFERWWSSRDFKVWKNILYKSADVHVTLSRKHLKEKLNE